MNFDQILPFYADVCYIHTFEARVGGQFYHLATAGRPEAYDQCSQELAPAQALSIGQIRGLFKLTNLRTFDLE